MMSKTDWLSIAKFGSIEDRSRLMDRIHIVGDAPKWVVLRNSVKGFFAEMVVEAWMTDNLEHTPAPDNDVIFEKGDAKQPVWGPDGTVRIYGGDYTYDIKSTISPDSDPDGDLGFKNTHNADFVWWHHNHTITILARVSSDDRYSPGTATFYTKLADYDALLYENRATRQLKKRFEELTNDIQHI
jgi:hypothetical protein